MHKKIECCKCGEKRTLYPELQQVVKENPSLSFWNENWYFRGATDADPNKNRDILCPRCITGILNESMAGLSINNAKEKQ